MNCRPRGEKTVYLLPPAHSRPPSVLLRVAIFTWPLCPFRVAGCARCGKEREATKRERVWPARLAPFHFPSLSAIGHSRRHSQQVHAPHHGPATFQHEARSPPRHSHSGLVGSTALNPSTLYVLQILTPIRDCTLLFLIVKHFVS